MGRGSATGRVVHCADKSTADGIRTPLAVTSRCRPRRGRHRSRVSVALFLRRAPTSHAARSGQRAAARGAARCLACSDARSAVHDRMSDPDAAARRRRGLRDGLRSLSRHWHVEASSQRAHCGRRRTTPSSDTCRDAAECGPRSSGLVRRDDEWARTDSGCIAAALSVWTAVARCRRAVSYSQFSAGAVLGIDLLGACADAHRPVSERADGWPSEIDAASRGSRCTRTVIDTVERLRVTTLARRRRPTSRARFPSCSCRRGRRLRPCGSHGSSSERMTTRAGITTARPTRGRGVGEARGTVARASPTRRRGEPRSESESRVRDRRARGSRRRSCSTEVLDAMGSSRTADFGWPNARTLGEYDGAESTWSGSASRTRRPGRSRSRILCEARQRRR